MEAATSIPENDVEFHRRREAQECELAYAAPSPELREIHFRMAEHHAAFVMQAVPVRAKRFRHTPRAES